MNIKRNQKEQYGFGDKTVGNITFYLYLLYLSSYLLHFTARLHVLGAIRFDLVLFITVTLMLIAESDKLSGRFNNTSSQNLFILLGYIIISLPLVEWPGSVLRENVSNFIKVIAFFYFTILIIDTDTRLKQFVFVFMACEIFRIIEPLYLHFATGYWGDHTYLGAGEYANRLSGAPSDIINPNGLAFVIATVFPFVHYLWGSSTWKSKICYLFLVPMFLSALILTLSRSGLIALMVVIWDIFIKSSYKLLIVLLAVTISIVIWENLTDIEKDRYLSLTGSTEYRGSATFYSRIHGFSKGYTTILEKPIVGHGLGTSKEALFNKLGVPALSHILYEEVWIELGIIGFIIYMLFIKSIYDTLKDIGKKYIEINKLSSDENMYDVSNKGDYDRYLMNALFACFWMFLLFSFAQYGVSEFHWYLIAGLSTVLNRKIGFELIKNNRNIGVEIYKYKFIQNDG